jgi:hypothetical protein
MGVDLDKFVGEEKEAVHGRRDADELYRSKIAIRSGAEAQGEEVLAPGRGFRGSLHTS